MRYYIIAVYVSDILVCERVTNGFLAKKTGAWITPSFRSGVASMQAMNTVST